MKRLCLVAGGIFATLIFGAVVLINQERPVQALGTAADCGAEPSSGPNYSGPYNENWHRFPYGFLCPRDTGVETGVSTRPVDSSRNGGETAGTARQVPGGFSVTLEVGFNHVKNARHAWNDGTNRNVYIWSVVDGAIGSVDVTDASGGADPIAPCSPVNPYAGVNNDANPGVAGMQRDATHWGDNVNDPDRSPFAGGSINCDTAGRILAWELAGVGPDSSNTGHYRRLNIKFKQYFGDNTERAVCVRTYVSVRRGGTFTTYPGGSPAFNYGELDRVAGVSKRECYKATRSFVQGHFRSSNNTDAGTSRTGTSGSAKNLSTSQFKISIGNCSAGAADPVATEDTEGYQLETVDANGNFNYGRLTKGGYFCMHPPDEITVPDSTGNTTYRLRGMYLNGQFFQNDTNRWHNQVAGLKCDNPGDAFTQCSVGSASTNDFLANAVAGPGNTYVESGYEFIYDPVQVNPVGEKAVVVPAGLDTPVAPGDTVEYNVLFENNRDMHLNNVRIQDLLPLNMEKSSFRINSVRVTSSVGTGGPGYTVPSQTIAGCSAGLDYMTGSFTTNGGPSSSVSCGIERDGNGNPGMLRSGPASGATPPNIYVTATSMPAYSRLVLRFQGTVKSRTAIGVYPGTSYAFGSPNFFCHNPASAFYSGSTDGRVDECEDKSSVTAHNNTNYVQAVVNVARGAYDAGSAPASWSYSTITYNPIPGDVLSVVKDLSVEKANNVDGDAVPEYDPAHPDYDNGTYRVIVNPDTTKGPVVYQVIDQNNGAQNLSGTALNPIIRNPDSYSPDTAAYSGHVITWPFSNSPHNGGNDTYAFGVTFKSVPGVTPGEEFTNTAKACWRKYWEVGHGIECEASAAVSAEYGPVDQPFFGAKKGGLRAGGGVFSAPNALCIPSGAGNLGQLRANTGSYGQYAVSVGGPSEGVTSQLGLSKVNNSCRPDIKADTDAYSARGASFVENTGLTNFSGAIDGAYDKKVVNTPTGSDVTINGTLNITKRWTLYVNGDLLIKGNIENQNGALARALLDQPSLGIVVSGNVYIDPAVTRIDALIYATNRGSLSSKGVINTCAEKIGATIKTLGNSGTYFRPSECANQLRVNGMLMGRILQFSRARLNSLGEAEIVEMPGRTYILPPPGFTKLFSNGSNTVTEKRPRF